MGYLPIADSEVDAESPITESLMTRLRDNALAFAQLSFTVLNGSGNYTVPDDITKLRVIMVSGGAGGGGCAFGVFGGGGGGGGRVAEYFYTTTGGATIAYACGAGGAGAAAGGANGSNGGNTTFGTLTCNGGIGGKGSSGTSAGGNSLISPNSLGNIYFGGHGGDGINAGIAIDGYSTSVVSGVGGAKSTNGGGGGPMAFPFWIDGIDTYLGNGGTGGPFTTGGNATNYGAGGGGAEGASGVAGGGNGSAGIIFVLPIG